MPTSQRKKRVVMARLLRMQDAGEKGIDFLFWQRVGAEGRFSAAWEMNREVSLIRGGDGRQSRLQRSVQTIARAPR